VAAVASREPERGGGDYVWRIAGAASANLELCHPSWAERRCRIALFDGGPNPLAEFAHAAYLPILIDPLNLAQVQTNLASDSRGNLYVVFSMRAVEQTLLAGPNAGVWAVATGGVHHCALEADGEPRCRALKVDGAPISLKTYELGGVTHEAVWLAGAKFTHCEVVGGEKTARCVEAVGAPPVEVGARPLSSHVVAEPGGVRHAVWFQTIDELWRCQTTDGAPVCARVKGESK
jgi:hypothetical protein